MPHSDQKTGEGKPRTVDSKELLAGAKTLFIQHGDQQYQLRVTKENKLILTK
ncbi:hemin uptake protein HemP [Thiomicrorhabdus sp. 6S2-11]|jgi:hemin uptake protein HemP|uniref:Hemin uptake protein HemP n=1 Tax=Thiomicrorhabdus marina TaxID=2818442 RepID=A0ABS3Q7Q9_9GAMM|nr:hemin uptake protein HemP [Thiomicrorhabdus marina]MBO1927850.1 hemin uptake protein HemP [Thiomicrorhabdus marina]